MKYTTTLFLSFLLAGCTVHSTANDSKTFFINGIASASPAVGYGIKNLYEEHGSGAYYAYSSPAAGLTHINSIVEKISKDPSRVKLIGMSYGARIVHKIAHELDKKNINVQYIAIVDGAKTKAFPSNVVKLDNFYCTGGCIGGPVTVSPSTTYREFSYPGSHIPFANDARVHSRILSQL